MIWVGRSRGWLSLSRHSYINRCSSQWVSQGDQQANVNMKVNKNHPQELRTFFRPSCLIFPSLSALAAVLGMNWNVLSTIIQRRFLLLLKTALNEWMDQIFNLGLRWYNQKSVLSGLNNLGLNSMKSGVRCMTGRVGGMRIWSRSFLKESNSTASVHYITL